VQSSKHLGYLREPPMDAPVRKIITRSNRRGAGMRTIPMKVSRMRSLRMMRKSRCRLAAPRSTGLQQSVTCKRMTREGASGKMIAGTRGHLARVKTSKKSARKMRMNLKGLKKTHSIRTLARRVRGRGISDSHQSSSRKTRRPSTIATWTRPCSRSTKSRTKSARATNKS